MPSSQHGQPSNAIPAPMPRPNEPTSGTQPPPPRPTVGGVSLAVHHPVATVTLTNGPVTPQPIPTGPQATSSGVKVFAGDVMRPLGLGEGPSMPPTMTPMPVHTPVQTLVQQFDAQRTQELAARASALEQLRAASPEQRSAIIAEMQAATQRQSAEQREAARELRSELRAMREERKGR